MNNTEYQQKKEEILIALHDRGHLNSRWGKTTDDEYIKFCSKAIDNLILDLIGEDEDILPASFENVPRETRNQLKATLRNIVKGEE